jgi:hypothetical protein
MNKRTILGAVLAVLGVAALLFGGFSYTESKPVLDAGPLHVTSQEEHDVSIPVIAGVVILIAGLGLIVAGRRAA